MSAIHDRQRDFARIGAFLRELRSQASASLAFLREEGAECIRGGRSLRNFKFRLNLIPTRSPFVTASRATSLPEGGFLFHSPRMGGAIRPYDKDAHATTPPSNSLV